MTRDELIGFIESDQDYDYYYHIYFEKNFTENKNSDFVDIARAGGDLVGIVTDTEFDHESRVGCIIHAVSASSKDNMIRKIGWLLGFDEDIFENVISDLLEEDKPSNIDELQSLIAKKTYRLSTLSK